MLYPAKREPDVDALLVTFPDIPEAVTFGADETEASRHAFDVLSTSPAIKSPIGLAKLS